MRTGEPYIHDEYCNIFIYIDESSNENSNLIANVRTAEIVPRGIIMHYSEYYALFKVNNTIFIMNNYSV